MKQQQSETIPQEETAASNDAVTTILEAHFESYSKPNIDALIKQWDDGAQGQEDAILFLYRAANDSLKDFLDFLAKEFRDQKSEEALKNSYNVLNVIFQHASGNLPSDDPILGHCVRITTLSPEALQRFIGNYFKNNTNSYLEEKSPEIYQKIHQEFVGKKAANDEVPNSSVNPLGKRKFEEEGRGQGL